MNIDEALETLLKSYQKYYNIKTEEAAAPFAAEAVFHSHDEQYFLVKSARLAEADAHEYVFFAKETSLSLLTLKMLDECAWKEGTGRVVPHFNHRSTDIVLVVLAEQIEPESREYIKKIKRYKSYCHTLQGWSHYSVVALETSTGDFFCNRRGRNLKKLFRNIK